MREGEIMYDEIVRLRAEVEQLAGLIGELVTLSETAPTMSREAWVAAVRDPIPRARALLREIGR